MTNNAIVINEAECISFKLADFLGIGKKEEEKNFLY